jgi:NAD(P)-dependent dehydrogenase (short-subunit alcohol dehydrogenase family)
MISDFKGKTAVLTGAGSGFGLECARIGARLGMNLVLVDVQQDALDAAAAELRAAGAPVLARKVDVSSAEQMEALAVVTRSQFGAPHFVFNNAGVGAGGLVWENSVKRLGVGAGREPVGRDPWRAPVHADDARSRGS